MHELTRYIKYSLGACVPIVACLIYMEVTRQNQSFDKTPLFSIAQMVTPFIIWWLAIRSKKLQQKNKISFKEAFLEGFKLSVVFGVLSASIFVCYYLLINPQIVRNVREVYGLTSMSDTGIIAVDMTVQIVSSLIFGSIYAAIIGLFLKTKKA